MNSITDVQLVQALRDKKSGAIEEAYRRYGNDVLRYAQRQAPTIAEDVQQQVFLHLTMHAPILPVNDSPNIRPWLLDVAKTTISNWKRARKNHQVSLPEDQADTYNVFETIDKCDNVENLLGKLSPKEGAALRAIYLEGLTYDEAARKLGVTRKAMRYAAFPGEEAIEGRSMNRHQNRPSVRGDPVQENLTNP